MKRPSVKEAIGAVPTIEILDIGAMAEGEERFSGLVEQGLAHVTGFEPNEAEVKKLQKQHPKRTYHPYFLGKGGPATFHITRYPGCSSLYEPDPTVIDLFTTIGATPPDGNFAVRRTEGVETHRLDDVPGLPACDYLKIDVQGGELDVLHHGVRSLSSVLVIESEVEFVPLYKGQPLFGDIQSFLREQGFLLHKFIDIAGRTFAPLALPGNPYAPMSQVLWADAVFVRDFSRLDLYSDDQLLKTAAILYEVYHSQDLVHRLLSEYDSRRGSAITARFTKKLAEMPMLPLQFMNLKLHP